MKHQPHNIDPGKYYSINAIVKQGLFPAIKSPHTLSKYISTGNGQRMFKPITKQTSKYKFLFVKGSTLIDLKLKAEEGKLTIK